jgi:chromosome partitioning protein
MADTMSQNPPPIDISTLACGLGDRTFGWKIPRVHLVPLNAGYLAVSAVVAADEVLLPLQVHYLALQVLGETLDEIEQIRKGLNPNIKVAGVLPVMYNKYTNIGNAILDELKEKHAKLVYPFEVDFSVRHIEASVAGLPIVLYDPAHQGAIAYNKLADTFL